MNPQGPKYQQKSKAIPSAEPNYFVHFAMRHPVYNPKTPPPNVDPLRGGGGAAGWSRFLEEEEIRIHCPTNC